MDVKKALLQGVESYFPLHDEAFCHDFLVRAEKQQSVVGFFKPFCQRSSKSSTSGGESTTAGQVLGQDSMAGRGKFLDRTKTGGPSLPGAGGLNVAASAAAGLLHSAAVFVLCPRGRGPNFLIPDETFS